MNNEIPASEPRKEMKRSKKMLAELTLYENKTEDVRIFSEVSFTRSGNAFRVFGRKSHWYYPLWLFSAPLMR